MSFALHICLLTLVALLTCCILDAGSLVVNTHCGPVRGLYQNEIWQFKGIPYAKSTLGDRRWTYSEFLEQSDGSCWKDTFNATEFGPVCPQLNGTDFIGEEDCLSLNIFTKRVEKDQPKPVFVYVHGGGLMCMSSMDPTSNVSALAADTVAVTLNYRLGALGFFATKSISERKRGKDKDPSGNYGISDIILALKWIHRNIRNFGGDPDRITIAGQSSGGTAIYVVLASPLFTFQNEKGEEKPLFHNVFTMSASPNISTSLSRAQYDNSFLVEMTSCKGSTGRDQLLCLQSIPVEELVKVSLNNANVYPFWSNGTFNAFPPLPYEYQPGIAIVDGYILDTDISTALSSPQCPSRNVSIVIGTMAQEVEALYPFSTLGLPEMTKKQYVEFLVNWPGFTVELTKDLLELYPFEVSPYHTFLTLVTDIRVTCGNIHMAKQLSRSNRDRPLYYYNASKRFKSPVIWDDLELRNSFHTLDLIVGLRLFDIIDGVSRDDLTDIRQFSDLIHSSFVRLAQQGNLDGTIWNRFNQTPRHGYIANRLGDEIHSDVNFKEKQCQYFHKIGWDKYWWFGQ